MSTPDSRGSRSRQRIIDAADQLIYERGYHATSFTDIAAAADIPRGNFYYYFKTKDDILNQVIRSRIQRFVDRLQEWSDKLDKPKHRLMAMLDMLEGEASMVAQYGCPMGTLNAELSKTDAELKQLNTEHFIRLKQWVGFQFAELSLSEPETGAMRLLARVQGVVMISNVFADEAFFLREINEIKQWISQL